MVVNDERYAVLIAACQLRLNWLSPSEWEKGLTYQFTHRPARTGLDRLGCGRIGFTWWARRWLPVIWKISDQVWSWSHWILERSSLRGVSLCLACHKMTLQCGPVNQPHNWRFAVKKQTNKKTSSDLMFLDDCCRRRGTSRSQVQRLKNAMYGIKIQSVWKPPQF